MDPFNPNDPNLLGPGAPPPDDPRRQPPPEGLGISGDGFDLVDGIDAVADRGPIDVAGDFASGAIDLAGEAFTSAADVVGSVASGAAEVAGGAVEGIGSALDVAGGAADGCGSCSLVVLFMLLAAGSAVAAILR